MHLFDHPHDYCLHIKCYLPLCPFSGFLFFLVELKLGTLSSPVFCTTANRVIESWNGLDWKAPLKVA